MKFLCLCLALVFDKANLHTCLDEQVYVYVYVYIYIYLQRETDMIKIIEMCKHVCMSIYIYVYAHKVLVFFI